MRHSIHTSSIKIQTKFQSIGRFTVEPYCINYYEIKSHILPMVWDKSKIVEVVDVVTSTIFDFSLVSGQPQTDAEIAVPSAFAT